MKTCVPAIFIVSILGLVSPLLADVPASYNVVWTTQSRDSVDSMPLAGGVLGLNVWVENNDLLFLLGSPNCMDENGMQTKLGLIRIKLTPTAFEKDFRQVLDLNRSEIVVSGKTDKGQSVTLRLWCDVNKPVVHVELDAAAPVDLEVGYETWSNFETVFVEGGAGFLWRRRLADVNARRQHDLKAQGMEEFAKSVPDPLSRLTEGGWMAADGLKMVGNRTGKFHGMKTRICSVKTTRAVKTMDLLFVLRMEQHPSIGDWESKLGGTWIHARDTIAKDRQASLDWWKQFWDRSYILVNSGAKPEDKPWQAGRNYQLIRYMLAANRNGRAMTLFNGGVFPCTGNPDSRNWDGCQFMAQNQRLVYWPMLRSGDFDLLQVATDFYRDRTAMSRLHAKKFWGVDGVAWSEPFSIFGLDAIGTNKEGRSSPRHLNYHYTSGMEFALMMLEMGSYSGTDLPGYRDAAEGIISYYDQYYQGIHRKKTGKPLDGNGKLVIYPSDACEPYHGCTNNTDVIAGLTALTRQLLDLPLPAEKRAYYEGFQQRIPSFAIREKDGKKYYAAAEKWEWVFSNGNMDFPQMYVCFPFNILSLGRSDMSLAKNTWDLSPVNPGVQHQNQCWYQSAINLARMGMAKEAGEYTLGKLLHAGARFPVFYRTHYARGGGEFCHLPDTDHGGASMLALQEMLMQTDGRRILLAPAWPKQWECQFKLSAPYQTTVEGKVEKGKVTVMKITPPSRGKDIEILGP